MAEYTTERTKHKRQIKRQRIQKLQYGGIYQRVLMEQQNVINYDQTEVHKTDGTQLRMGFTNKIYTIQFPYKLTGNKPMEWIGT